MNNQTTYPNVVMQESQRAPIHSDSYERQEVEQ